ncbi:MAG: PEP-CTERM sorting domain-containing protein [Opitutaceae bacterium]|jgi:hypothetical protein|nr:PEP-CTERM sorting domain-containing protein [Opitutaceae bacterium]
MKFSVLSNASARLIRPVRLWNFLGTLGFLGAVSLPGSAQQILLSPGNLIGGGASYYGSFDSGVYSADKVLNQQTGAITDIQGYDMWLGEDGASSGYFVLDLGAAYKLDRIDLVNTHNEFYNDRGTDAFTILVSNSITDAGEVTEGVPLGMDLVSPVTLLTGTLTFWLYEETPVIDVFSSSSFVSGASGTAWRYLLFRFDSINGGAGGGLNEIRLYTAIPEPSTFALLAGVACLGLAAMRRPRRG